MERAFVVFATRWGAHHGGINTLNVDLCRALTEYVPVVCVVANATPADMAQALPVRVLSLDTERGEIDEAMAPLATLRVRHAGYDPSWWIGHDTITGGIALAAARRAGGRAALFHHMHYESYKLIEGDAPERVLERSRRQRALLMAADAVFAIGPLLMESAVDLTRDRTDGVRPREIIPGLASVTPVAAPHRFSALISGRLDERSARNKQLLLSVAAFARAARDPAGPVGDRPMLYLMGSSMTATEAEALDRVSEEQAKRRLERMPVAYTADRDILLETVAKQSVVFMLSWHDGFGLVAWEALAAGVPIIISESTGVAKLIIRELGDEARELAHIVFIRGRGEPDGMREEDLENVADAVLRSASDTITARRRAMTLRTRMGAHTWTAAAHNVYQECQGCARPVRSADNRVAPAFTLGEAALREVGGCAAIACVIVDRPEQLRIRLAEEVHRIARMPQTEEEHRIRLQQRGFHYDDDPPHIREALFNFLFTAPLKAYVSLRRRTTGSTINEVRRDLLVGLLTARLAKKNQRVAEVRYREDLKRDVVTAAGAAWATARPNAPLPAMVPEPAASDSVTTIADAIARIVAGAHHGDAAPLQRIRIKVVHIWDSDKRTNYGVSDPFP